MDVSERRKIQNRDAQRRFRSKKSAETATQRRGSGANHAGNDGGSRARPPSAALRGPTLRPRQGPPSQRPAEDGRRSSINQADRVFMSQSIHTSAGGLGRQSQRSPPHWNFADPLSSANSSSNALGSGVGSSTNNVTPATSDAESRGMSDNALNALANVFDLRVPQMSDASVYGTGATYTMPPDPAGSAAEKERLMQDLDGRNSGLWPIEMMSNDLDLIDELISGAGNLDFPTITDLNDTSRDRNAESMPRGDLSLNPVTALRGESLHARTDPHLDQVMRNDHDGDDDDRTRDDTAANSRFPAAGADDYQQSALHIAAEHGHAGLVTLLLSPTAGLDRMRVDERDSEDNTPLHCACFNGRAGVALSLLQHGADPNARNTSGWTPVHFAVLKGETEIVKVLTRFGADLSLRAHGRQYCRSGKVYDPL